MDALAEELRRALLQRSSTLASRISHLRGSLGDERSPLADVLDLFGFFPKALDIVVEIEWNRAPDALSRVQILRPFLRHVLDVSDFVDDWLSHAGTASAPVYLVDAVGRACLSLGLDERRVVIGEGRADEFRTVVGDIETAVFDLLGSHRPPIPTRLQKLP